MNLERTAPMMSGGIAFECLLRLLARKKWAASIPAFFAIIESSNAFQIIGTL
jgi:hypothetical protein